MPTNPGVSEVVDKDGVTADIEAKRFDGTRTVQMQGDVTASQTWNGDSNTALTLNASIGAKKVTQDKIADKAVGTGQMADGSVGLTQMAASAMTDTVSANNSKLVTSQGVNAAIAAATLNRGKDYGPMSVDEINAISETIPTGSTVYVESLGASDAKVINDGYSDGTMASFSVEVGEDLKYYRAPDNSLHGWYSTEANVKIKQPANYSGGIAVDSAQDASSGSAGIEFIQSFKQDTNGNIRDIVKAQVDLVDSTSSTRTNAAATPNSVKSAYDLANTANTGLANKLDKTGDGKDVTATFSEASTRSNIGTGEKLSVMFGKIKKWFTDLGTAAFKNVPASGNASTTQVVMGDDSRLEAIGLTNENDLNDCVGVHGGVLLYKWAVSSMPNNAPINGTSIMEVVRTHSTDNYVTQTVYVANKSNVYRREYLRVNSVWTWTDWYEYAKSATTLAGYGITDAYTKTEVNSALASKVTGPSSATADDIAVFDGATGKLVKDGGKKLSDFELVTNKVSSWQTTPDDTHYPSEKLVKDELDAKADANNCIAISDSIANNTTQAWYKLAERTYTVLGNTCNATFLATICNKSSDGPLTFFINTAFRFSSSAGGSVDIRTIKSSPISKSFNVERIINTKIRLVVTGSSGNATVALYLYQGASEGLAMTLSEVCASGLAKPAKKGGWTYTTYSGSSSPGETTEPTGSVYKDMTWVFAKELQTAVSDPTASGTALEFIDSFTQNANGEASVTKKSVTVDSTPTAGSSNPVSSGGVKDSLDAISTAAGAEAEVTAAALDDLDERMQSVEDAVNSDNIGDKIADSFDAQVLKMGGENLADLLGGKVDKEAGKGLSTNDFTDAYKSNVDANTQARHSHSNKTVLDGISSSDIDNWNAKQASLNFMTDTDVDDLFTAAWDAANS